MKLFRRKRHISIQGYKEQKDIYIHPKASPLKLRVRGYDNEVQIKSRHFKGEVWVQGVGNKVIIEEGVDVAGELFIAVGYGERPCFNCTVIVGKGCYIGSARINLWEDNSSVIVGEDCMFSINIDLWCTDGHALWGEDGKLRLGREVRIGKHVWVGKDVKIGKNSIIADDCVVGWGSVVAGKFEESACVIAGAPATVRRQGVRWDRPAPSDVQENRLRDHYPDWDLLPPPCFLLRPFLRLRLLYLKRIVSRKEGATQERYLRKIELLERRLSE